MKLIDCVFLRRSILLAGVLFIGGFLLTFLLGSAASTDSLALIGLGYLGLLMTVASLIVLALTAVIALLPGFNERLSTC